jgi:hypothetical protein
MKPLRRAKFLMLSALLPLAGLATFLTTATPAHAYTYPPSKILPLDPYQVHLGDGSGCGSNNLTAWGWNFYNGEHLIVNFYVDGSQIGNPVSTTAYQLGVVGGFFGTSIPTSLGGNNDYTASVTEPDGLTWWATESIIC